MGLMFDCFYLKPINAAHNNYSVDYPNKLYTYSKLTVNQMYNYLPFLDVYLIQAQDLLAEIFFL